MSKRTLMITMNADWRGALRAAGKRATARSYQGEVLNFESAASFFVIGPDKQLDAWEQYLQGVEGPGTRLQRLYGRDLWMP